MPGSPQGIPDWAPTIADLLKNQGYATGQFGKNHLGDRDTQLPTVHGFDEFLGNLYHLNAEEEPETYYYPKDPEFRKQFGPRGVIHSWSDGKGGQKIEDTGPLTQARMPTVDLEIYDAANKFIDSSVRGKKPFFVWFNTTRMHIWTHLKPSAQGRTGISVYADGMVEHDDMVGGLLKRLDELGIADNTIVVYGTDNGAETATWPDGGTTPFRGEKGTTWEGGFRVPMLVRWPGVIKPGTIVNDIFSQEDWLPTLLAAAGEPDVVEKLKTGYEANGKTWKVHADGYNFLPYLKGEAKKGPREEIFYFGQGGDLNAVRWNDWKVSFATDDLQQNRFHEADDLAYNRTTNWNNYNSHWGGYYSGLGLGAGIAIGASIAALPLAAYSLSVAGSPYWYSNGVYYAPQGGTYVVTAPPVGAVVPTPPPACDTVDLGAGKTYDCGGAFYSSVPSGYEVIPPPIGVAVRSLPNGATQETVNGISYFTYGAAWYQPSYTNGGVSYMVVSKPG
jgi:arylsulfatase A-like enzyme